MRLSIVRTLPRFCLWSFAGDQHLTKSLTFLWPLAMYIC